MIAREARAFPTMLRIGFAELVAYRGEVLIWIMTTTMPLIMYAMWSTIAREAPVGRFDESTFAAYFLCTLVVRQLTSAWVVWELNFVIRKGELSTLLLRPVHPLVYYAAQNLGALPFRFVILVPLTLGAFMVFPKMSIHTEPWRISLALLSVVLAWFLIFLVQSMLGLLALYTEQSLSFQEAWYGIWAILSGYLIPLELIPEVQAVALWLPFRAMGSLPTEIILGHLDTNGLAQGILVQIGWATVMILLVQAVWKRAIRRYEAFGG